MTTPRTFAKEFKRNAVRLAIASRNVSGTARGLGIASRAL
jgi:transposase-like protein